MNMFCSVCPSALCFIPKDKFFTYRCCLHINIDNHLFIFMYQSFKCFNFYYLMFYIIHLCLSAVYCCRLCFSLIMTFALNSVWNHVWLLSFCMTTRTTDTQLDRCQVRLLNYISQSSVWVMMSVCETLTLCLNRSSFSLASSHRGHGSCRETQGPKYR